ncbi:serpin family protein [Streptomonospora nanhaiensis]|uniref:Serpin B n=1 Tax=Streptomonospora nanhaiensis TaxID=1323731 RepID=A0A853BET0_9ACTN|nr:serpin family protein [Streptomonospora nanhaiensis]MBV2366602.1 serpin family protein [Streptomonospora nanhaiensis]MBX9388605.1 serpin family protein [Streptomonospora nanhaiensis]NYI93843.1 serpin B [Streptomonospora nanhaiensis]
MPVALRSDQVEFATRLTPALGAGGELAWSPLSVAGALGLLATGARGRTRQELAALLGPDLDTHLAALDDAVTGAPELATLTSLWVRDDLPVRPEFTAAVKARPNAAVRTADFAADPEGVRRAANAEVSEVTRGLIAELLRSGDVNSATRALLVNALWVRVRWSKPFDPADTAPHDFRSPSGTRRVPMMRGRERRPYARAAGWRMVTVAAADDLALDVLLPEDESDRGVPTTKALHALYRAAAPTDVDLALPRFEVRTRAALSGPLRACGAATVFTDDADLSGVSEHPLRVDEAVHEAVLRVDEKGAVGAAATAVVMRTVAAMPSKPVRFVVDRPFAFILRRRGGLLFLGTVTAPTDPGRAAD